MNHADAAFLCQGDGCTGFGDCVHGSREYRNIEANGFGHLRRGIYPAWHDITGLRYQQYIIKCQAFSKQLLIHAA